MPTLSDFTARSITGTEVPLSDYTGQLVLVVNTASKCGLTPQYAGLEELWASHGSEGLVVLGFPCDQFGHQEPGDEAEIADFCELNYGVSFPMFAKVEVNGDDAHPLFPGCAASSRRPPARRSSGTSPSSWSTGTAAPSAATTPAPPPRRSSATSPPPSPDPVP